MTDAIAGPADRSTGSRSPTKPIGTSLSPRRALRGWLVAATVYLLAVFHRSSLGVASLLAERRFDISPVQLSAFVLLQVGVYAAMQVPTGVLVDRYGPRRLLVVASLVMGTAQLLFAIVPSYPAALLARALLGCGDAMTFISVLRFVATHFSARRYPVLVAVTSMVGTVGNLAATLPLTLLLRGVGWGPSFAGAGVLSLLAAVGVWLLLGDTTPQPAAVRDLQTLRAGTRAVGRRVRLAWGLGGTRLGFWVHFACMSTSTAFGLLWGYTYLVKAAGFSSSAAGEVLLVAVLTSALASPLIGWVIGHRPAVRVPMAITVCLVSITGWLTVIGLGEHPPSVAVAVLFVVMTLGGPSSMVAFALARDYNPARTLGTASGVVNVGGFVAAIIGAVGMGLVMDVLGGIDARTLRWAVLVAVGVQVFGTVRVIVWFRRVRASALARQRAGETVPVVVVRRRWDLREPDGESPFRTRVNVQ